MLGYPHDPRRHAVRVVHASLLVIKRANGLPTSGVPPTRVATTGSPAAMAPRAVDLFRLATLAPRRV